MQPFKKILVPVDFSDCSKQALLDAIAVGAGMNSEIAVLHAYENPAYVLPMSGYVGPTADMLARLRNQLTDELEAMAEQAREKGLTAETQLIEGIPYKTVVDFAKEWGADLIVMGTHGRTGLSHALTGSVAERVVRLSPCPVLVSRLRSE
jgi:universal stress protein A